MRLDKKDANKKTRDFLGFSSFYAIFLIFWNSDFSENKKMPNGILGQGSRSEPLTKRKMGMQVLLDTVKYDVLYIFWPLWYNYVAW